MSSNLNNPSISLNDEDIKKQYVCIDIKNEDWYVKITDGYGHIEYLNIRENLSQEQLDNIKNISEIFEIISDKVSKKYKYIDKLSGIQIEWTIADTSNLYSIRNLQQNYWNLEEEPQCFDYEDESIYYLENENFIENINTRRSREKTFFDRIVENL